MGRFCLGGLLVIVWFRLLGVRLGILVRGLFFSFRARLPWISFFVFGFASKIKLSYICINY